MKALMVRWFVLLTLPLAGCGSVEGGHVTPDAAVDAFVNVCGDGVKDPATEECDDANTMANDGCSPTCTEEQPQGDAAITATWQLFKLATNTPAPCPTGFDTAAVYNQPIDAGGNNAGATVIDLFDCSAGTGTITLPAARYRTWIEVVDHNNTQTYAQSLSAVVDVTFTDKAFTAQILTDGGYFQLAWSLIGASSNQPLTCAQAGADAVESIATDVSSATNSASDIFDCTDGTGVTAGFLAATYTVSVDALNASNQSLGTAPALTNKVINPQNQVTDLGTITIPIDGH